MPSKVLTTRAVEALKAPATGQLEVFDASFPGFGIRVSKGGRKAWILFYRIDGRKRRLTLGAYPALSLADARTAASNAVHKVQRGDDPATEKRVKKATRPVLFEALAQEYIDRYAKVRKRSWKNDEINLRLHILPHWKHKKIEALKRADVIALVDAVENGGQPHLARHLLAVVRKVFNWAIEKSLADSNPATGIRLGTKLPDRARTLSFEELRSLWAIWDTLAYPWGPYFKLLLMTAQRRSEIANMRWDQINDGVWTIPAEANKSGRLHIVPLPSAALDLLATLPRTSGAYVFAGRSSRGKVELASPISGFSAKVRAINKKLDPAFDWRIHDLRRTATSQMARLGFPPHILAAILNHAPQSTMKGVLAVYNRYEYLEEKRDALEAWSRRIFADLVESVRTQKQIA